MKRKYISLFILLILLLALIRWMGVGPYISSSASRDLTAALAELHGEPYFGRPVENGSEDMEFFIEGNTIFPTNYNLRRSLGLDYRYTCKVIYTTHSSDGKTHTRTVTYTGYDPMGKDKDTARAYIDTTGKG